MCCNADILLALLAVIFPPIAANLPFLFKTVWIKSGLCTLDSLINILLCMVGYLPGVLHAWYIIAKYPEPSSSSDYEDLESAQGGHVTYYYVTDGRNNSVGDVVAPTPQRQQYPGYGTVQGTRRPSQGQQGVASGQQQQQQQQKQSQPAQGHGQGQGQEQQAGEGSSQGQVPPSYEQAVAGDNKVQT
ncbi:MAG: hypothetical protein Q9208_005838 [Pyrenodesmia sp. 3 TL-2023]